MSCDLCGKETNWIEVEFIEIPILDYWSKKITLELCYECAWFIKRKHFIKRMRNRKRGKK